NLCIFRSQPANANGMYYLLIQKGLLVASYYSSTGGWHLASPLTNSDIKRYRDKAPDSCQQVLDVVFVLVQQTYGFAQCITTEGVTQLTRTHDLNHAGLAFVHLHVNGTLECRSDLIDVIHNNSLGTHGCGHFCVGFALNVTGNKATVVELNLVFLLGTPLTVVEYHSSHRNVVTDGGHNFDHTHGP